MTLQIQSHNSIKEIDPGVWNSLISPNDLFHQHHFLQALDASRVENARMEFLLIYKDKRPIASAVLSNFKINLDLFIGETSIVRLLKKLLPRLFKANILFCGTPISAGHKNLFVTDESHKAEVIQMISEYISDTCQKKGIPYSVFKEFKSGEAYSLKELRGQGYFQAYSLPNAELELPGQNFDDYLISLRHPYRRQIKNSLKKIGQKRPSIDKKSKRSGDEIHFELIGAENFDFKAFYRLYISVMDRAEVKLEILNETFFENFFRAMHQEVKILCLYHGDRLLGAFVISLINDTLSFIWTGKEGGRDQYDTYSNLMTAMIQCAYDHNCKTIVFGQTSYYPKQRMGAQIDDLHIFFKCHKYWKHRILEMLNPLLFPQLKPPTLKVFKS